MAPMEAITFFLFEVFLISLKISCEGPTAPPGESIRMTIALIELSSRKCFRFWITFLASAMIPLTSMIPTFSPNSKSEVWVPNTNSRDIPIIATATIEVKVRRKKR